MSYCRFFEAEAYIYASVDGGIECCMCSLHPGDFGSYTFTTYQDVLDHVAKHRENGDYIPESVDKRLKQEMEENGPTCDVYVPIDEQEESALLGVVGPPVSDETTPSQRGYAAGYLQGMIDSSWKCYDCGNIYENIVEECPNKGLDQAHASYRKEKHDNELSA